MAECGQGCGGTQWAHCSMLSPDFIAVAAEHGILPDARGRLCVEAVLEALLPVLQVGQAVTDVQQQLQDVSGANIPAGVSLLLGKSSADAAKIGNRNFVVVAAGGQITYDFTEFKNGLPGGVESRRFRLSVVDAENRQRSITGASGKVAATLPARVTAEATVQTQNGFIEFRRAIYVAEPATQTLTLQVSDLSTGITEGTVGEILAAAATDISILKQRIEDLEAANLSARVTELETTQ